MMGFDDRPANNNLITIPFGLVVNRVPCNCFSICPRNFRCRLLKLSVGHFLCEVNTPCGRLAAMVDDRINH
jgi:hypothetical protein